MKQIGLILTLFISQLAYSQTALLPKLFVPENAVSCKGQLNAFKEVNLECIDKNGVSVSKLQLSDTTDLQLITKMDQLAFNLVSSTGTLYGIDDSKLIDFIFLSRRK